MDNREYRKLRDSQWSLGKFFCIGIDPEADALPEILRARLIEHSPGVRGMQLATFASDIVKATADLVHGYKLNLSNYAAYGNEGFEALRQSIEAMHILEPRSVVILDAKYGGATAEENRGYAAYAFDYLKADAVTIQALPGAAALKPFLERKDKGVFVVCRTSEPKSGELQELEMVDDLMPALYTPFYESIAYRVAHSWNKYHNCGLVVGANQGEALRVVRLTAGDIPILSPAFGYQQRGVPLETQVERAIRAGKYSPRELRMVPCSSRSVIYASGDVDYAEAARLKTLEFIGLINRYR